MSVYVIILTLHIGFQFLSLSFLLLVHYGANVVTLDVVSGAP